VLRRSTLILSITFVCLAAWKSDRIEAVETAVEQREIRAGIIEYLRRQNQPVLRAVEVWNNPYGPGLKLTTAHYEIFTTLLKPLMLRQSAKLIELAYKAYNLQLPEPVETRNKFVIYLFADRWQWEAFTNNFAGEQAEIFCRIKAGGRHFKFRLPSWLDEGVAMLFEVHRTGDGTFGFEPAKNAYRLDALKKTMSKGKMLPLRDLIVTTPGDVLATDQTEAVLGFYSQSYALIRFLRESGDERLGDYRRLLADSLRGNWPLDETSRKIAVDRNIPRYILWNRRVSLVLFHEYIGDDYKQIEKEYLAFCRRITKLY